MGLINVKGNLILIGCILLINFAVSDPIKRDIPTGSTNNNGEEAKKAGDLNWWKNAVFYQIYPRSFMDLDNDGTGDLKGIIQRLDHLVDLGVTALWLSPIFKSPMKDFGYDISDFRDIDPIFGDMDDFKALMKAAKDLKLRVILDFVPNHSSDQHEWFQKSVQKDPKYENYYVWRQGKNNNTEPPNNWLGHFHGSAWTFNDDRKLWYLHQYHISQPDLNFRAPEVHKEMTDIMTFWLDLGVDGFRVDTVPSLYEDEDFPDEKPNQDSDCAKDERCYWENVHQTDQPETYDVVYKWREFLDGYTKEKGGDARIMMTESYSPTEKLMDYYKNKKSGKLGAHFSFNFFFITKVKESSTANDMVAVIKEWQENLPEDCVSNWVLGNHDNHRLASRYGVERSDGMIMLQMILPGVGVTYNGEEIAMENGEVTVEQCQDPQGCDGPKDDFAKNSRDFERTPFQWNDKTNAGFNTGHETWLPVSSKYKTCNAELQQKVDKSPLKLFKDLIKLRQSNVLLNGDLDYQALSDNVLQIDRSLDNYHKILLLNLSEKEQEAKLKVNNVPNLLMVEITNVKSKRLPGYTVYSGNPIKLDPYEALILSY